MKGVFIMKIMSISDCSTATTCLKHLIFSNTLDAQKVVGHLGYIRQKTNCRLIHLTNQDNIVYFKVPKRNSHEDFWFSATCKIIEDEL